MRAKIMIAGMASLLLLVLGVGLIVHTARQHVSPNRGFFAPKVLTNNDLSPRPPVPSPAGNQGMRQPDSSTPRPDNTPPGYETPPTKHPIFLAAFSGKLDEVKKLVAQDPAAVRLRDPEQHATALHWAIINGKQQVAAFLIAHGADIEAKGKQGMTPLHAAAYRGDTGIMTLLLARGANIDAVDNADGTALLKTVGHGHLDAAKLLLAHGARVNVKERDGGLTPLHAAIVNKYPALVQLLLAHGADIKARDKSGATPLLYAQMARQPEIVKMLTKAGAKE